MRSMLAPLLIAAALSGCMPTGEFADRGVSATNVPVLARTDFVFDAAAPGGVLAPGEAARLDAWFRSMSLAYGDTLHVDGGYGNAATSEIAALAGAYGMMVSPGAPVTGGMVRPDSVRVIVSRARVTVPNCPNWDVPASPNWENRSMSNFGCAVNTNLAAMVADPNDLVHGRAGSAVADSAAGAKAVNLYRGWPLTAVVEGQEQRPLKSAETRGK